MPEDTQLPPKGIAVIHRSNRPVHPKVLMVPGNDLGKGPGALVKQNEILKQIHKVRLGAHPLEHGLEVDNTGLILIQPLPILEVTILGRQ